MIGISKHDFERYGCPCCGYYQPDIKIKTFSHTTIRCNECKNEYAVLADGFSRAVIGHATKKKDSHGMTEFEFPYLQKHPREGIYRHQFIKDKQSIKDKIRNFIFAKKY